LLSKVSMRGTETGGVPNHFCSLKTYLDLCRIIAYDDEHRIGIQIQSLDRTLFSLDVTLQTTISDIRKMIHYKFSNQHHDWFVLRVNNRYLYSTETVGDCQIQPGGTIVIEQLVRSPILPSSGLPRILLCNGCYQKLEGKWFQCTICCDYHLCDPCKQLASDYPILHNRTHDFMETRTGDVPPHPLRLDAENVKHMLRRENELRLSKEVQAEFAKRDWLTVVGEIQEQIAHEHGFLLPGEVNIAVHAIRTARQLFPDDPEMYTIPLYVRHNRAHDGPMKQGDSIPDLTLESLADGTTKNLSQYQQRPGIPLVLLAGSYT